MDFYECVRSEKATLTYKSSKIAGFFREELPGNCYFHEADKGNWGYPIYTITLADLDDVVEEI